MNSVKKMKIFTGGGNIVFDEIYCDIPDCATGFPLYDDIPLNVHSIGVDDSIKFYTCCLIVLLFR